MMTIAFGVIIDSNSIGKWNQKKKLEKSWTPLKFQSEFREELSLFYSKFMIRLEQERIAVKATKWCPSIR